MGIRAFCKKNLAFTHPSEPNTQFKVKMMDFTTLPDWVAKDPLFTWAKQEGSLEVLEEKQAEPKKSGRKGKEKEPDNSQEEEPEQNKEDGQTEGDPEGDA